jgi:hypothetical protein
MWLHVAKGRLLEVEKEHIALPYSRMATNWLEAKSRVSLALNRHSSLG